MASRSAGVRFWVHIFSMASSASLGMAPVAKSTRPFAPRRARSVRAFFQPSKLPAWRRLPKATAS